METECHDFREPNFRTCTTTTTTTKSTLSSRAPTEPQGTSCRRSSLSIIQPKVCLNEMLVMARRIWLSNGSNAADIPLPMIAMKFKVLPVSGLSEGERQGSGHKGECKSRTVSDFMEVDAEKCKEPIESVDVQAELDLGVLLQRWLTKLTDIEACENSANRRSAKQRQSGIATTKNEESTKSGSKMSPEQASAESMFNFCRDRANSELLRPWAVTLTSNVPSSDWSLGQSSGGTISNLVRQVSNGSIDLCLQSVDLLSSNSTASELLSDKGSQSEN